MISPLVSFEVLPQLGKNILINSIRFAFEWDDSEGDVVIASIWIPDGLVEVIAEGELCGKSIILKEFHVQGLGANQLGASQLRAIGRHKLETLDYDQFIIEGGRRTTGASKGRRPKQIRIRSINRSDQRVDRP